MNADFFSDYASGPGEDRYLEDQEGLDALHELEDQEAAEQAAEDAAWASGACFCGECRGNRR